MTPRKAKYALLIVGVVALFLSSTAKADNPRVTSPTDFWFEYSEPTQFYARTFAVDGAWSDPMLWLYDENGTLITANDDYHGLQSQISIPVEPGLYRLRAGVCCGDPDRWYTGVQYELSTNGMAIQTTTTIESWTTTTTTNTLPPTTEPSTTSSPTSSSTTTTTLPDPPTTTSTLNLVTTTEPSSTTTVNPSPSTVSSSSTSLPTVLPTLRPSPTTTLTTTPTSTSTIVLEASTSLPETTTTTTSTLIPPNQETTNQNGKTYSRKVSLGPIQITLTATEAQRKTVIAAAIVQITTVATISTTGVATNSSTSRRRP